MNLILLIHYANPKVKFDCIRSSRTWTTVDRSARVSANVGEVRPRRPDKLIRLPLQERNLHFYQLNQIEAILKAPFLLFQERVRARWLLSGLS